MLECGWQFTHAIDWLVSEELHPNAPLTQSEMTDAAWAEAKRVDAELQVLMTDFMNKLDAEDQALLKQSNDAWTTFREKYAELEGNAAKGGSLSPQLRGMSICKADTSSN
jgi:uncharacterized protein YecT (DUF1311 family)